MQIKPRFKKRFSSQSPSTIPRVNKCNGSTPKPKEEKDSSPYVNKSSYAKCGKTHEGKCLVGRGNCYGYGKSGPMKRDSPMIKSQGIENAQAHAGAPDPDAPKKNHLNFLR